MNLFWYIFVLFLIYFLIFFRHVFLYIFWYSFLTYFLIFFPIYFLIFFLIYFLVFSRGWGPALPTPLGGSPVETRRSPLRSRAPRWGPALPTPLASSPLRAGATHCNLELRSPCPRRLFSWGPALPMLRPGDAQCDLELIVGARRYPLQCKVGEDDDEEKDEEEKEEEGEKGEEEKIISIKSHNPYLTGGEKCKIKKHNIKNKIRSSSGASNPKEGIKIKVRTISIISNIR